MHDEDAKDRLHGALHSVLGNWWPFEKDDLLRTLVQRCVDAAVSAGVLRQDTPEEVVESVAHELREWNGVDNDATARHLASRGLLASGKRGAKARREERDKYRAEHSMEERRG